VIIDPRAGRGPLRARALLCVAGAALAMASGCASGDAGRDRSERAAADRPPPPPLATSAPLDPGRPVAARDPLAAAADDAVLVRVGASAVRTSDLLADLRHRDPDLLNYHLNMLVGARMAELDAAELGLRLSDAVVDRRTRTIESSLETRFGVDALDDVVTERLGVEPEVFRRRLRDDARRELLVERVVRAWTLRQDSARLRIAVVPSAQASEVAARFADGESFESIARSSSLDPTAERGGVLGFVVRSANSRLGTLAFRTPVGELGGPIELDPSQDVRLFFVVEELFDAQDGGWGELGQRVESSLDDWPMDDEEYVQWQIEAEHRHGVDLAPLSALLGEDLR